MRFGLTLLLVVGFVAVEAITDWNGLKGNVLERLESEKAQLESLMNGAMGAAKERLREEKDKLEAVIETFKNAQGLGTQDKIARTVEKRNIFTNLLDGAKNTVNSAFQGLQNFLGGFVTEAINKAREAFANGLASLVEQADGLIEQGVGALHKYLPGLQGLVSDRVDALTSTLDKYITENDGKMNELQAILLENAQKALNNLKEELHEVTDEEGINKIVNSVENLENQVQAEVDSPKSRSLFGFNWNGLKSTVIERLESAKARLESLMNGAMGAAKEHLREEKEKLEAVIETFKNAEGLGTQDKIAAVKEATAQSDEAEKVVAEAKASA